MKTWRGCPCLDFNMLLFFAHAPLDEAVAAFTKTFDAKKVTKDVMGNSVKASAPAYLAYQFAGHSWTVFDLITTVTKQPSPDTDAASKLSKTLKGRAMLLKVSDTGGYYQYAMYDAGKLVQRYLDGGAAELQFESADSKVERPDGGDVTQHFDAFARSQDILVPPFGTMSMFLNVPMIPTKPFELEIEEEEEFNADDVVRVDLITLA